ncbi:MAG: HDOD domain-containing protein [Treponemataceae bacterium]|nr:HDOD domain-containing protein [Treponemataceae bacterium]
MSDNTKIKLDLAKIKKAVQSGIPLSIMTYTFPHEAEIYVSEVITAFFHEINQENMTEYIIYSMNELITNAKKANTKRIYFKEKNLDINNQDEYELGMKTFKADTMSNIKYYLNKQKTEGYFVKLILQLKNDTVWIEIHNNSRLSFFEYKRIHDKMARAEQYESVDEAFNQIIDDTEGAGLGLIIMILMLKKLGISSDHYQVYSDNKETVSKIIIPLTANNLSSLNELSKEYVDLIDAIPQFPDNIMCIHKLITQPDMKLSEVAAKISSDVALTADLLKIVNSAAFSLATPCRNIHDAVKLVGTRGIKNLLYSIGSMKSLEKFSPEQKNLWFHCSKVAAYAKHIAKVYYPSSKELSEDIYVCALLHDIGRVVFNVAHPQLVEKFKQKCKEHILSMDVFERITAGLNHSEVGAQIAEKWNFPDVIVQTIRYHHDPLSAPEKIRTIVVIVYFANMIANYQDETVEFYQFEPVILKLFNMKKEGQLKAFSDKLAENYSKGLL